MLLQSVMKVAFLAASFHGIDSYIYMPLIQRKALARFITKLDVNYNHTCPPHMMHVTFTMILFIFASHCH